MDDSTNQHQASELNKGDVCNVTIERMAHGGEGIAVIDSRVVFVKGAFPGDTVHVRINQVKKSFARAELVEVLEPSELRGSSRCEAAAHGGGCCDFHELDPEKEVDLKKKILIDQLQRVGRMDSVPEIDTVNLAPHTQWRTRVRLGVDSHGRAGVRKASSTEIITTHRCAQAAPELYSGVMGEQAPSFTPGAEVVSVIDDAGERHVVEIKKASRGRRSDKVTKVHQGSGQARQTVEGVTFELPATAFWQAHTQAAAAYSDLIQQWLTEFSFNSSNSEIVGWDLYGGVGAFVPALRAGLGPNSVIHSVEASRHAAASGENALSHEGEKVVFHTSTVEKSVSQLPAPQVVVLDPPRVGAGTEVISAIAQAQPEVVIHIGCDPATFARDTSVWAMQGYVPTKITLFNAFPGTHHMETMGLFVRSTP